MRPVAPQIKAVEHPVQFLNRQHNRLVAYIRRCFEALGFQALEPKAEAIALPIQHLDPITGLVEKNEKHRVEHRDFDIQLNQSGQAIDGFSEVHGLGVQVDFFNFGVGTHHGGWLLKEIGSTASVIRFRVGMWALWRAYKIHTVSGTVFLVTPGLFQRYVQEFPGIAKRVDQEIEEWRWVQKQFENLKVHRKRDNGLTIWAGQVQGPRKRTTLKGYVIEEPKLFFELTPPDNPFLKIDDIASTGH